MLKNIFSFVFLMLLGISFLQAQSPITTPAPSPSGTVKQKIGLAEASVTYSRPSAKGREVFGKLVPFGEAWRTGANGSTLLTIDADVTIENVAVAAGTYGVYTIPNKEKWEVILSKNTKAGGDMSAYKAEDEVLRVSVAAMSMAEMMETFTIQFSNLTENSASLELAWEKTKVALAIRQDVHSIVMKQIENFDKNPMSSISRGYYSAASYLLTTENELPKALEYINKAIEYKYDTYWVYRTKALIQAKMKDFKGAIASSKTSIEKAEAAGDTHYAKMGKESIEEWSKK